MEDFNLDDLAVFVRVIACGAFAKAARELGTPTSTVSRAITRLEAKSGVRLVHRTTRALLPTEEGRELYASVAPAVATLRGAARSLEPATWKPKGRLRVTAPVDLCSGFLAEVIVAFLDRYPHVDLDFMLTNRRTNLVGEEFDLALRATARLDDSSLVARKLGDVEHRLYASPRYLAARGAPSTSDDLRAHACVVFRAKDLARPWALRGPRGAETVEIRARLGGDDFTFARSVIAAGGGIGLLPAINCGSDVASGRLVRVLPELHARGASLYLIHPFTRNMPPRVSAFRDFVVAAFSAWSAAQSVSVP